MTFTYRRTIAALALMALVLGGLMLQVKAYTTIGHAWSGSTINYATNLADDASAMSDADIIAALAAGAAAWHTAVPSAPQFARTGASMTAIAANDGVNNVIIRNAASPNCTYCMAITSFWWDGTGRLVDFDVVLYEANYTFFPGTTAGNSTTCTGSGEYVADVMTHEFGHALGMTHSADSGATMYPTNSYCDTSWYSLEADDIAGVLTLYPAGSASTVPADPTNLRAAQNPTTPTTVVDLTWTDNSSDETGFKVERATALAGPYAQIATPGVPYYSNTGLSAGTTYFYKVRSYNGFGNSGYTGIVSATTADAATASAPGSPSTPSPADGSSNVKPRAGVVLKWAATAATSYAVYFGTDATPSTLLGVTSTTQIKTTALVPSTAYYWRVVASNAAGSTTGSIWSFTTRSH